MGFELKSSPDTNVEDLVKAAGGNYYFDNDGPNDYGEILRLYQSAKQVRTEYELQYSNTFIREKELESNIRHAICYMGAYFSLFILDIIVKAIFNSISGFRNTFKGILATMHFGLLLAIAIGAVLVALPFTLNLLKQIYLYRMLTNPSQSLDDDRAKFKVVTLQNERAFLQQRMDEYNRLFGQLEILDKNCKGVFYSYENKQKADELMACFTPKDIADMHSFVNSIEFRAKSVAGKESISAWWIVVGAMVPLIWAIFAIAQGMASGQTYIR